MKSNQSSRRDRGDKGEVGIGTMIVFIAAVIVAAIAAAVLVNTAGNLERKASETGQETTDEVSGNIFVRDIVGGTNVTAANWEKINDINLTVSLAPGADPLDLTTMHVRYQDNETLSELSFNGHGDGAATDTTCSALSDGFCVLNVQEEQGTDDNVLEPGDIVHLNIALDDSSHAELLETRVDVEIVLMPETGSPIETGFQTPASINGDDYLVLK